MKNNILNREAEASKSKECEVPKEYDGLHIDEEVRTTEWMVYIHA